MIKYYHSANFVKSFIFFKKIYISGWSCSSEEGWSFTIGSNNILNELNFYRKHKLYSGYIDPKTYKIIGLPQ